VQNVQNVQNAQTAKNARNAQNAENPRNAQNAQNAENARNAQNAENARNANNAQNAQNVQSVQNAANARNTTNAQNAKNAKNVWNADFVWTDECQQAFDRLKSLLIEAPILVHFHPEKSTVVETDASDFALGAVLSQLQPETSRLHPVAYHSRKFKPAEINYDIHDKEMLAIVAAFTEWSIC
jgi:hypothetical protein